MQQIITNPVETPQAVSQHTTKADVLYQLFDKGILTKQQISKAMLKLKVPLKDMMTAFAYVNPKNFLAEFVMTKEEMDAPKEAWSHWTLDEMKRVATAHYQDGLSVSDIASGLSKNNPKRTYKSVKAFMFRTWEQGNMVDEHVVELFNEGYTWEQVSEAGYSNWRAEFTYSLMELSKYCAQRGAVSHRTVTRRMNPSSPAKVRRKVSVWEPAATSISAPATGNPLTESNSDTWRARAAGPSRVATR